MGISIITYGGKTRTAKHDAMVYDAALNRSGIFNGCAITANSNVLSISLGYGIIKGRVFEITPQQFSLVTPGSGVLQGALIVTLDLSGADPITLETKTSTNGVFTLDQDRDVNFASSRYQMVLAKYSITPTGITNLVSMAHELPLDHIGSTDFDDYIQNGVYYFFGGLDTYSNVPKYKETDTTSVVNGWLFVYESNDESGGWDTRSIKQVFMRHGSVNTHMQTYVRTKTGGEWHAWVRLLTESDLYSVDHGFAVKGGLTINYGGSKNEAMLYMITPNRKCGLNLSVGDNFGFFDFNEGKWILYQDKNGLLQTPRTFKAAALNISGNLTIGEATDTTSKFVMVQNKYRKCGLNVSNNENAGIWDNTHDNWIIMNNKAGEDGITYIPARIHSNKTFRRGSITFAPSAKNTATGKAQSWSDMGGTPTVYLTPITTVGGVTVGVANASATGCTIYLTRPDTASTTINWFAVRTAS